MDGAQHTADSKHATPPNGNLPRLITLGRLAFIDSAGQEQALLGHKRKLALLAVLALSTGPISRDDLIGMFWAEDKNQRSRRHSLSNTLSFLRGILGVNAISAHRAEIELAPRALSMDAAELLAAAQARDFTRTIESYTGAFLDGVSISGSNSFEEWAKKQRDAVVRAVVRSGEVRCAATAAAREWYACADTARRWLEADPHSAIAALHLLNSVRASGRPDARVSALAEYDRLAERLARVAGVVPDPRVTELAHRIQARLATDDVLQQATTHAVEPRSDTQHAQISDGSIDDSMTASVNDELRTPTTIPPSRRRLTNSTRFLAGTAIGVAIAAVAALGFARSRRPTLTHPLIAVTDVANVRGDTASAWLEDGLPQMITGDLSSNPDVEMIGPVRVRATRARARLPLDGELSSDQALDLGRRLGASLIVRGGFTHGSGLYVLDLTAQDASTGRLLGTFTVSGPDPLTVAGWAAGRLLDLAGINGNKPRLAEVETNNLAAYQHFVRSVQASSEGRFADARRELDASIALDSGFASALAAREDIAESEGDTATLVRIRNALPHARLTPWDMLEATIDSAQSNGENSRSLQLANALVARYPHDPRAYATLADIYTDQGEWGKAQATAQRALALDSLANEAGAGPCAPCTAYAALIQIELMRGDLAGAERTARRWLELQPDLPIAWGILGDVLDDAGRYDAGLDANRRAAMLSGNDPSYQVRIARALIAERRISSADSVLKQVRSDSKEIRNSVSDLQMLALRERGQLRESNKFIEKYLVTQPRDDAFLLEEMDALGRLGDYTGAARLFDRRIANLVPLPTNASARGNAARWFCWTRAMEANAIAGSGDTVRLHAIADSIRTMSAWSYFDRDRRLYHHVLGLIAMHGKRYAEAEREFQAARWGVAGWTETVAWLARAQLAQNKPLDTVASLRQAYEGPLDAMGRYEPHSELDSLMAVAFRQAGLADSASVYARYASSKDK